MALSLTTPVAKRVAHFRFGMGPKRAGALEATSAEQVRQALLAELEDPNIALLPGPSYQECCRLGMTTITTDGLPARDAAIAARFGKHLQPQLGFVERLVLFWSNHFSMYIEGGQLLRFTLPEAERSRIRANVLGNFGTMLRGVVLHPAMINYLNNQRSAGPNSQRARNSGWGHNENLGREILELHTVGVESRYTQEDVIAMSMVLTGVTYNGAASASAIGQYTFVSNQHALEGTLNGAPAAKAYTILGKSYAPDPNLGDQQVRNVLNGLARDPNTAKHIARKLLQHFVMDEPVPASENWPKWSAMVETLQSNFIANQGDLKKLAIALLNIDDAWTAPLGRFRQPHLWLVSIMRALGLSADVVMNADVQKTTMRYLTLMSNAPWFRLTPDGYSDLGYIWMGADAVRIRMEIVSNYLAQLQKVFPDMRFPPATALAGQLFGTEYQTKFQQQLQAKDDNPTALTLLFMSPEFLYR